MKYYLQFILFIAFSFAYQFAFGQAEPSDHVTSFTSATNSTTSITLSWTGSIGSQTPDGYLIVVAVGATALPANPIDATVQADDFDLSDNLGVVNVTHSVGANNYIFTSPTFTPINAETLYKFKIYPYKTGANINYKTDGIIPETQSRTYSLAPSGHSTTFTSTLIGNTQIDLAFDAASTLTNADGYLIYRRLGSAAVLDGLNNGAAPPATLTDGLTTLIKTTNTVETTYSDVGLSGGVTYHYILVPFNYDGANNSTYNFLKDGSEPRTSASTTIIVTITQIPSGGGSNIASSPLNSAATNQAILGFSITTNGSTTFNALNVALTSTPSGKFTNPRIFSSADVIFGGDASIKTGTQTATQLQFGTIGASLTAGTTNYFIVVDISATVNASTPAIQPSFTQANITFTSPSVTAQSATVTGDSYSFVDATPPTITFSPTNGATNFSAVGNITITFNEPARKIDDSPITQADIEGGLVELRLTNSGGTMVPFTGTINGSSTIITIDPTSTLLPNQIYFVKIEPVEDAANNATSASTITFTTEDRPSISGFTPSGGTCIGDNVTVNGLRFRGTGSPSTGSSQPTVTLNGVTIPPANIVSHSPTQVVFTLPPGSTTGPITVKNNDSDLTSTNSSSLNVFPAIDQSLPVSPATLNPAQNTNVNITVSNTQSSSYKYSLIITAAPGGYTTSPPATVHGPVDGNNGTMVLNTSDGATQDLTHIGDYTYRIDVARTGCATKTLSNTPITLTVASLNVTVSATNTSVCAGGNTILIASTSGGTGFYQFAWSGPNSFSSSSSSPTITPSHPAGTGWYVCTLSDNSANTDKDSVYITTHPGISATIDPAPGETVVRTEYTLENFDYRMYGSPAGGIFNGQGIIKKADGNYYFNPQSAGLGSWLITYSYTDGNNCTAQDSRTFNVKAAVVVNLDDKYCQNINSDSPLQYNAANFPAGYQFTRLVFIRYSFASPGYCIPEIAPTWSYCGAGSYNPLTVNSFQLVPDIQAGVTLAADAMFNQPVSYTIDLAGIRANYGYTYNGTPGQGFYFYVLVYGKDQFGTERYLNAQYFIVLENEAPPEIVGIVERENVCSDATSISLSSSNVSYTTTGFTINPSTYSASLSGTNNSIFNPGHSSLPPESGTTYELPLAINMAYTDRNNCPSSVARNFTWIKKPSAPFANDTAYCQVFTTGSKFFIKARKKGPASNPLWYEVDPTGNPSALVEDDANFLFSPKDINGTTPLTKTFYVRQVYNGCVGNVEPVNIEIKAAPNSSFTVPSVCENKDFILEGPKDGSTPYAKYTWSFGDPPGTQITKLDDNFVTFNYGPGTGNVQFTIGLQVINSNGCSNSSSATTTVGLNPVPDFFADFICENDTTRFTASTNIPVSQFEWDFGDGSPTIGPQPKDNTVPPPGGGTYQIPRHMFNAGAGTYNVKVTSYTSIGCSSSETKPVLILDYKSYTTINPYRMAAEDGEKGYWKLKDVNGNTSWMFNTTSTPNINSNNEMAWVTNPSGNYSPDERSFINSPCLDISAITKPVFSINYASNTQFQSDGAVLEYSKDGIIWAAVGASATGIEWFNTPAFFTGLIGNSTVGWSGNKSTSDKKFLLAKHALDNVAGLETPGDRTKLRFRIAFASNNDLQSGNGFAFNKVTIESRNRNLLVENFTQAPHTNNTPIFNTTLQNNNTAFNAIDPSESVKLQYHLSFPEAEEALSAQNMVDPNARAAYYGINNNASPSLVPRAYIDGYSQGSFTDGWDATYRGLRSLSASPLLLNIITEPIVNPDELKFKVSVDAIKDMASGKPVLQVVIVEKNVGTNNSVIRKMIPNAAGTLLTIPLVATDPVIVKDFIWKPENPTIKRKEVAIVAFVQDEITKDVYQAFALLNPDTTHIPNPTLITGLEDPTFSDKIQVFPNPANHELHVVFPGIVTTPTPIQLVNTQGQIIYDGSIATGEQRKTINTSEFAGGVYILQLRSKENVVRKKVMIVHHGN